MSTSNDQYRKFSFLTESQEYLHQTYDLSDKEFIQGNTDHNIDISNVKKAAVDRVLDSIDIQKPYRDPIGQYTEEERLLSYPIARVLVALADNPFLYYLFSVNEARRFVNLSTQVEEKISSDKNIDVTEVDQTVLLSKLGYTVDEEIPINLLHSLVPDEHLNNNTIIENSGLITTSFDVSSKWLDTLLLWAIVPEVNEGLDREVPEFLQEELESEAIIIQQNLPEEFMVSKRGLNNKASYKSVSKVIEDLPPALRESAMNLNSDTLVSDEKREMVLRTLLDLDVDIEDITKWLEFNSKWARSYGRDMLFDLQGDIQYEKYGFTSYRATDLRENGVLDTMSSIYQLVGYSPVYTVLNTNNQLHPGDNIRPPEQQAWE